MKKGGHRIHVLSRNRYVKWEALLEKALALGADYIATGHYARIVHLPNGRYAIEKAAFDRKDQTYALYNLNQHPAGAYPDAGGGL